MATKGISKNHIVVRAREYLAKVANPATVKSTHRRRARKRTKHPPEAVPVRRRTKLHRWVKNTPGGRRMPLEKCFQFAAPAMRILLCAL